MGSSQPGFTAAGNLISLWLVVGGCLHLYRLPVLYRRIIAIRWCCEYYNGCFAVVVLVDALPPLLHSSGGCFTALATSTLTDALPSWLLLVGRPRRMLCHRGVIMVDA